MQRQDSASRNPHEHEQTRRLADRLDRLSVPLAENVIRRAIELHHDEQFDSGTIDLAAVEQIGSELGITPDLIRRALLEELQTERDDSHGVVDWWLGPDRVTGGIVARDTAEGIDARVADWMRRHEGMRPRAKSGRSVRWEKDSGLGTTFRQGTKRAQGTGSLRTSAKVITRQTEIDPGRQLVEIEADTSNVKPQSAAIGLAAAAGAAVVGAAVAGAGGGNDVVEFLAGFLPGVGAAMVVTGAYARAKIQRAKDGINRAIDGILHSDLTRANEDRRYGGKRRPSWMHIVEEIVDEIFD